MGSKKTPRSAVTYIYLFPEKIHKQKFVYIWKVKVYLWRNFNIKTGFRKNTILNLSVPETLEYTLEDRIVYTGQNFPFYLIFLNCLLNHYVACVNIKVLNKPCITVALHRLPSSSLTRTYLFIYLTPDLSTSTLKYQPLYHISHIMLLQPLLGELNLEMSLIRIYRSRVYC